MHKPALHLIVGLAVYACFLSTVSTVRAGSGSSIDFEGLAEGAFVSQVSSGAGVRGEPVSGFVSVFAHNPDFPGANSAMLFDATCAGGCSGQDDDLYLPALGNVLIVSADLDQGDPDVANRPGTDFVFRFNQFGAGVVTVQSLVIGDVEASESGGVIRLSNGATLLETIEIPITGDGVYRTVPIGVSGVRRMRIVLRGSAAIDEIRVVAVSPPAGQGCSSGYWKEHPTAWVLTRYSPNQSLEFVFEVPDGYGLDSYAMLHALGFTGGAGSAGAARALSRAGVAALLNSAHPGVDYPRTTYQVISQVNSALASQDRDSMLRLASQLDLENNLGCPLD
jgi:hypothetical protein